MIADFPSHVQAKVRRILDAEARRLLTDEPDRDTSSTAPSGCHDRAFDRGPDQLALTG